MEIYYKQLVTSIQYFGNLYSIILMNFAMKLAIKKSCNTFFEAMQLFKICNYLIISKLRKKRSQTWARTKDPLINSQML